MQIVRSAISIVVLSTLLVAGACTDRSAKDTAVNSADPEAHGTVNSEGPSTGGGEVTGDPPEKIVAELYKAHDAKKGPFYQTEDRARVDKYFTKPFADLIWKYSQSVSAEETGFDADPLYNAQDLKLKNFAVGRADVKGESATVPVTFTNFGERVSINYKLRSINNVWKIDDIMYSPKDGLAAWLKERIGASTKAKASPGEFEGRYNVGDTTCTVEFKNKGYAVRWAKGSGEEYFSFMGGTTFASSTVESEANRFVFDDENYNFGTFFRADGKTFPVSRSR